MRGPMTPSPMAQRPLPAPPAPSQALPGYAPASGYTPGATSGCTGVRTPLTSGPRLCQAALTQPGFPQGQALPPPPVPHYPNLQALPQAVPGAASSVPPVPPGPAVRGGSLAASLGLVALRLQRGGGRADGAPGNGGPGRGRWGPRTRQGKRGARTWTWRGARKEGDEEGEEEGMGRKGRGGGGREGAGGRRQQEAVLVPAAAAAEGPSILLARGGGAREAGADAAVARGQRVQERVQGDWRRRAADKVLSAVPAKRAPENEKQVAAYMSQSQKKKIARLVMVSAHEHPNPLLRPGCQSHCWVPVSYCYKGQAKHRLGTWLSAGSHRLLLCAFSSMRCAEEYVKKYEKA